MTINDIIARLTGDTTCVVYRDGAVSLSMEKGIKPLVALLCENGDALCGAYIADRIIGRAAAYLAIYGRAAEVYGEVMTDEALEMLESAGIKAYRKIAAKHIINRRGDGICPMEAATAEAESPREAFEILKGKVQL